MNLVHFVTSFYQSEYSFCGLWLVNRFILGFCGMEDILCELECSV